MTTTPKQDLPVEVEPDPRRWVVLAVMLSASFMQLLDASITNVALPVIQRDLKATNAQIQLIVAAYLLTYGVLLITGGRIGDLFGRRRVFLLGMAGFLVSSVLCGAAQSGVQLDLARALQGITASFMLPQVLAMIQLMFPAGTPERSKAFAMYGMTLGLPGLLGPFIGGVLVQADIVGLSWRPIFLVNVPICVVAMIMAVRTLPESRSEGMRLDIPGVVFVSATLVLLLWPLIQGRQSGWPAWAWICLAASVPAGAVFLWWERRLTVARRQPLVPLTLFRIRSCSVGLLIAFTVFAAFTPFFMIFTLYLQEGNGFSPLGAGVATVPFALGSVIGSTMSAGLAPKLGRMILTVGATVFCVGDLGLVLTVWAVGRPLPHGWQLTPALLVAGFGLGLIIGPLTNIVLAGTPAEDAGAASGVLNNVNIMAGAVGIALLGVVFFGQLSARADHVGGTAADLRRTLAAEQVAPGRAEAVSAGFATCTRAELRSADATQTPPACDRLAGETAGLPPAALTAVRHAGSRAYAEAFSGALVLSGWVVLIAFLVVLPLTLALPKGTAAPPGH